MVRDIVYDETELTIAVNRITNYGDFISRSIGEYVTLLDALKTNGINDEKVCLRIAELIESIKPYETRILEECENIAKNLRKGVFEISIADNISLFSDNVSEISSLLSNFL